MMTENKKTKEIAELTAGFQNYILLDRKISRRTENLIRKS
jgi:hypothetical protein